jgi:hypothetical protein
MHFHPERPAVSINQQPMLTKALRSPLSSRAKPTCPGVPWRDLQCRSTNTQPRPRCCHPLVAIAAISNCYSSIIRSPLVIPSEADLSRRAVEGPAVPRTPLGNVFRQTQRREGPVQDSQ